MKETTWTCIHKLKLKVPIHKRRFIKDIEKHHEGNERNYLDMYKQIKRVQIQASKIVSSN